MIIPLHLTSVFMFNRSSCRILHCVHSMPPLPEHRTCVQMDHWTALLLEDLLLDEDLDLVAAKQLLHHDPSLPQC